jgi:hypothetical protein
MIGSNNGPKSIALDRASLDLLIIYLLKKFEQRETRELFRIKSDRQSKHTRNQVYSLLIIKITGNTIQHANEETHAKSIRPPCSIALLF